MRWVHDPHAVPMASALGGESSRPHGWGPAHPHGLPAHQGDVGASVLHAAEASRRASHHDGHDGHLALHCDHLVPMGSTYEYICAVVRSLVFWVLEYGLGLRYVMSCRLVSARETVVWLYLVRVNILMHCCSCAPMLRVICLS